MVKNSIESVGISRYIVILLLQLLLWVNIFASAKGPLDLIGDLTRDQVDSAFRFLRHLDTCPNNTRVKRKKRTTSRFELKSRLSCVLLLDAVERTQELNYYTWDRCCLMLSCWSMGGILCGAQSMMGYHRALLSAKSK